MIEVALILIFIGPSWLFAFVYWRFVLRKHLHSPQMGILNANLAKVGQYWSTSDGDFRELKDNEIEHDRAKMYRTFLFMVGFLSFLSFVGLILLALIFLSGRPRLELNTFESALARDASLTGDEVIAHIAELRSFC